MQCSMLHALCFFIPQSAFCIPHLHEVGSNLLKHPLRGALMLPEKLIAPFSHFFSCSFVLEKASHVAGKILYPIGLNRSPLLDQPARDL